MIAQHLGAGRRDKADEALTQGMVLSVIHGIIMMILCIVGIPYFLKLFTTDANVIAFGVRYATIAFSFSIVITVNLTLEKMYQAIGNMNITMVCLLIGCGLNILLDPMIIFGIGPFPQLGIAGKSSAGNRSRTVCASGDLSDCVCEKNKESRIPSGIYASDKTGCDTVIRHWCACYFKYGADFRADHGIKCDFGGIFPDLCAGAWYLL